MKCPSELELSSYLDKRFSESERGKIEAHIAECGKCLDLLMVAYEAQRRSHKCPPVLKERIRMRLGLKKTKSRSELRWFFAALFMFALSFVFKRYFLQFLIAAAILGFKWAMEGEAARRTIMIFKGVHKEEKKFEKFERKSPPDVSDIAGGDRYGKAG